MSRDTLAFKRSANAKRQLVTWPQQRALARFRRGGAVHKPGLRNWTAADGVTLSATMMFKLRMLGTVRYDSLAHTAPSRSNAQARLTKLGRSLLENCIPAICRKCGCTDERACDGGCHWIEPDLCSACVTP